VVAVNRIVMWLMSTVTVLVLLFGYHTSTSASLSVGTSQLASDQPAISSAATDTNTTNSTSDSGTTTGTSTGNSTGNSTGGKAKTTTITGDSVSTQFGPVQVQLTVAQGKITAVEMLAYPYNSQRDKEINARALPILIAETMAAQSAQIDMVSGATYTSDGYLQSLQSALDQAGL
jgi:uncharacterized protein with FMN-binding domain